MSKKCIFIIFMACILIMGACFSAWRGDEGTISISIGDGEALGRAAGRARDVGSNGTDAGGEEGFPWPDEASHTITLSGGPGPNQEQSHIRGGETVNFSVAPGQWTITINCFLEDEDGVNSENSYAEGSRTVNIRSGPNGVITIPMSIKVIEPDDYIDGSNNNNGDDKAGTLRWAIEVVQQTSKNIDILIDLPDGNNVIALNSTLPGIESKSIIIRAKNPVTIKRGNANFTTSFFTIGEGGALILDGPITIDGGNIDNISANAPLITIDGGTFIMNKDVTLQNNTNNNGNGGGVSVDGNGTFTMKGGTIKGNTAGSTGTTSGYGGGVYVGDNGRFSKTGGTIYGHDSTSTPSNPDDNTTQPSDNGHAVYVTAVYDEDDSIRSEKKRNTTADNTVSLNSEKDENWDE